MTEPVILTIAEVAALTHRERPKAQAKVLEALGVPFRIHPVDGALIVSRAAAERALGGPVEQTVEAETAHVYELNLEGIRKRGQAKTAQ